MNTTPLEDDECKTLVEYLDLLVRQNKIVKFTHTANETFTKSWRQKRRNKTMGVRSGIPDYIIVTHNKVLFLEMKRVRGGYLSDSQNEWYEALNSIGGNVVVNVGYGFEHAKTIIDDIV